MGRVIRRRDDDDLVDQVAIERVFSQCRPLSFEHLSPREVWHAVHWGINRVGYEVICSTLHLSGGQVNRILAELSYPDGRKEKKAA